MKIQKKLGAAVLSLGLVVGMSGFAGAVSGTIDDTGPRSDNWVNVERRSTVEIENDNNLHVDNDNDQHAWTGDAEVSDNRDGGSAETGSATNENEFDASVSVDNSSALSNASHWAGNGGGSTEAVIENTGPRSDNSVRIEERSTVEVKNNNNLHVTNNNNQTASSGDAEVTDNREGGDATTGDASNSNSTTIKFDVTN
ncbi:MAG: hypothetical protein ABWX90_02380 [Candidatus Saccharimonadales bacterium]